MSKSIIEWRGRNVEDMSKQELVEALSEMQQLLQETINQSLQDKQTLIRMAR